MTRRHHHDADAAEPARRPSPDNDHRFRHPMLLLIPVIVITVIAVAINRIEPNVPGPFYGITETVPNGAPGSLVRKEQLSGTPAGSQGWLVLYRSTGMNGEPISVSATVFAPAGAAPAGGRPVVAWAHPTTGVASRCAPSLRGDNGAGQIPGLNALLAAGYVVVATDYPGLGTPGPHPYLVGASEGMAVLDSVRAAHDLTEVGAGTRFATWGHSQGGQASLFAGQLAATYAPELTLVGVAAAAPATELGELLQRDIGGIAGNVLGAMALTSWSQVYAGQGLSMDQVVKPLAIPTARLIADRCTESEAQLVVELPDAEILKLGFLSNEPWQIEPWKKLLAENSAGAVAIPVPVLINQGNADTVVWPGVTTGWVAKQCQRNVNIAARLYDGANHTDIGRVSAADTAAWIAARFAGGSAASTCGSNPPLVPAPIPSTTTASTVP